MWQVANDTPFAASGMWVRDRDGAEIWLVAVRCSFRINADGTTAVADEQEPPVVAPKFRGAPGASSLIYDSDFYPTKPTTDLLLHGHAYAPGGKPATIVDVSLRVGQVEKTLRVTGDRTYQRSGSGAGAGAPQSFVRLPLIYERSFGGSEPDPPADPTRVRVEESNPVGTGFVPMAGALAPNIEFVGSGARLPAGFGPISPQWQPRVLYAGTYDHNWQKTRCPLYPVDLDDRFFLSSPEDQRPTRFLRGGEPVELVNLTPSGYLSFLLPRVAFRFETDIKGKPRITHRGALHTVILEPDVPRVVLVWRTTLRAHADVLRLTETRVSLLRVTNAPRGATPLGLDTDWREPEDAIGEPW